MPKVCLNHPDCIATSWCAECGRPLCSRCVTRKGRRVFCSPGCRDHFVGLHAEDEEWLPLLRVRLMHAVTLAVLLVLLLAIIGGCLLG